ncbi:hypothetical protein [Halorubrum trueperi]|uniref:Carbon starvation protein A n=1 Tax=Halorubrum trueperi TaxID=2004704 RepID=A0ABD5UEN8_9EURY
MRTPPLRSAVAGMIIVSFYSTWIAMEWSGREPDSLILLGAVAIVFGASYYLWDDAMGEGIEATQELQGDGSDDSEN